MRRNWHACLIIAALVLASCSGNSEPLSTDSATGATTTAPSTTAEQATQTTATPTTAASNTETGDTETADTETADTETGDTETGGSEGCPPRSGSSILDIEEGGVTYQVRVFVPASSSPTEADPVPVVLNWHGLGSDGIQQSLFTGYETLANSEGFIVAHPTGIPAAGDTRNAWELAQFDTPGRDDVAMVETLIDTLVADFCVDEARVYSTGMSNGGFFTSRLVCELSERIAAAVSVAGLSHHDDCKPERAVPFMAFHGTADDVVPYDGGDSTLAAQAPPEMADFFDQVMPDEFAEFAATAGCASDVEERAVSTAVTEITYSDCGDGFPMVFYSVAEGGHTWPGSPFGLLLSDQLGFTTTDVDATADGWAYMSAFSLDGSAE